MSDSVVRVASVPAGHVYVHHLIPVDGDDAVYRLPDPVVPGRRSATQWWPPVMLEPGWVRDHHEDFDVFHVHFGFEGRTPDQLGSLVAELRDAGKPLVYTVHDLRNPHQSDPRPHQANLDVLIPAADAVVTLTRGAAREIEAHWGVHAIVLPHPHVVDPARLAPRSPRSAGRFIVGVHAKSLRAAMDPAAVVRVLIPAVQALKDAELRVDIHTDVIDPAGANHDPRLTDFLKSAARSGDLSLHVHDYLSDAELWNYLSGLDVSVLAYRFGTHSGWLEACHDLGTTVIAPSCGYYAEQRPCLTYGHDETRLDGASLTAAVRRAYDERPVWQATLDDRLREREMLAAAHRVLYSQLHTTASKALVLQ